MEIQNKTQRLHNIDTLRILLMFMIVCLHYFGWGGVRNNPNIPLYNSLFGSGISILSWCAVNVFFMLSGYLSSKSSTTEITGVATLKRVLKIWLKVFIVNALFYLIAFLLGILPLNVKYVFCMFCPILSNQYWFITVFLLITAILPFLMRLASFLTNIEFLVILAVLLFFDSIQPLFGFNGFGEDGYGFLHAVTCVFVGFAIRKSPSFCFTRKQSIAMYLGASLAVAVIMYLGKYIGLDVSVVMNYNSPLFIIAGIGLLSLFATLNIKSKYPSVIAPYVLGIFLIQHQIIRDYLWEAVFHSSSYLNSPFLCMHWFKWLCIFMFLGVIIDKGVSWIIESVSKRQIKYA